MKRSYLLLISLGGIASMNAQLVIEPQISEPQSQTYYVAILSATRGENCGAYFSVTPMPQARRGQPQTYYIANLSNTDGANCGEYVSVVPIPQTSYVSPVFPNLASPLMSAGIWESPEAVDRKLSADDPDP